VNRRPCVWVRSACTVAGGLSITVNVSRSAPTAEGGAGGGGGSLLHPRKRLADCLAVPLATGVVCPQDLTGVPRPEASCPSGADSRDAVLTFVAPQAHTPTAGPLYKFNAVDTLRLKGAGFNP
jgi:hypothetical protein